jgi:hypothetical protein
MGGGGGGDTVSTSDCAQVRNVYIFKDAERWEI